MFRQYLILAILAILFQCCNSEKKEGATLFSKLSEEKTGITFVNNNLEGEKNNVFKYEYFYNGGGVALGDINNDSLVDIYFTSNQGENKLYLNKGNFKFQDITISSGTASNQGWKTGVAMVDINADGYLDIYVCKSAELDSSRRENLLFVNNGDLTFTDKAKEFGLNDNSFTTQVTFLDFDRDGDLDMFSLNHSFSSIVKSFDIRTENKTERVRFVGNKLYKNQNGKFYDISESAKIYGPAHNYGLGIACSDLNNDAWPDIYASNDYTGSDNLLINNKGRTFNTSTDSLLTHISRFSMGVDIADINNDGLMDIITLDMLPDNNHRQKELLWPDQYDIYATMVKNGLHHQFMRNMLHLNNGKGYFSEIGQLAGVSNTDWSWSALFADFDNDGLQDLFVTNGYKRDFTNNDFLKYRANQMIAQQYGKRPDDFAHMIKRMPSNKLHNYLFKNKNGILFGDVSQEWGLHDLTLTQGASYGDLDNDGDLDLVLNNMDESAGIYRNNAEQLTHNRYLKVKLDGNDKNRFGLGTKVTVYSGKKIFLRQLFPQRGFESSMEPALFFGVDQVEFIDSLIVQWPKGEMQKLFNIKSNQTITLHQKNAQPATDTRQKSPENYFSEKKDVLEFTHHENEFIDFKIQPLLLRMYSSQGPGVAKADVNNDGLDDLYIGGAKDNEGVLYVQNKRGLFVKKHIPAFKADASSEDVDAIFVDIDGDYDQDLYVVTGGYEFDINDKKLEDKLYENDGRGNFKRTYLPSFLSSGSCVRPFDVEGDGDIDLFVGGRLVPGNYPETPESYLLINSGQGKFSIETESISTQLKHVGMVTDAVWIDVNQDKVKDLVVVGEWMSVRVFINTNGKLDEQSERFVKDKTEGWWNCILANDFDGDGDDDLIIGNYGMNNQIKPSVSKPVTLYYGDFDSNNSIDPLFCYYVGERSYPFPTRDELTESIPVFKKKFPNYKSYADATIDSILSPEQLKNAHILTANRFETTYFQNNNGSLVIKDLPLEFQYAPIYALAVMDVNHDGKSDIISGGNLEKTRARIGRATANMGFVFLGNSKGGFNFVKPNQSGISSPDDIRKIVIDGDRIIMICNDAPVKVYRITDK